MKYGIEETKQALSFLFSVHSMVESAKANDGKIDLKDAPLIVDPLMKVIPALDKINEVGREIKDLDETEKAELFTFVKAGFNMQDVEDSALEAKIEEGLILVAQLAKFILNIK